MQIDFFFFARTQLSSWGVKDFAQGLNSGNLEMLGFAVMTFRWVAQSLHHRATPAYDAYP